MTSLHSVSTSQKEECHFPQEDLYPFMDELHDVCSMDMFWKIDEIVSKIKQLALELNRLEAIERTLTLRLRRLSETQSLPVIERIASIALFIHYGDLSILKFRSYIEDKTKQMERNAQLNPPLPCHRKSAPASFPSSR